MKKHWKKTVRNSLTPLGVRALQRKLNLLPTLFWYPFFHMCLPALPASSLTSFMPSQIFCAFLLRVLFFLAIKSDFLWSQERHNALSSFRTHITTPRLWHNFQRRDGETCSWSSRLSLGLWRQSCTSSYRFPSSYCPTSAPSLLHWNTYWLSPYRKSWVDALSQPWVT